MVALGTKTDYAKDMLFHLASIAWMMYGESKILATVFDIADEIDKPIACGVDVAAIAPFMTEGTVNGSNMTINTTVLNATLPAMTERLRRQLVIKDHCELHDGTYFIPSVSWAAERFWFDFFGIAFAISFALYSCGFIGYSVHGYWKLFFTEKSDADMHKRESKLDHFRGRYMVQISMLSFSFFLLYAAVLNKLTAFGVWERDSVAAVVSSKYSQAKDANVDTDNWADLFQPSLDALFKFEVPDSSDPLFLGTLVKNLAVYTSMTLFKNLYLATVASISDDLHVVSLILATPVAVLAIGLFFVPYLAALFCWKNVELANAMDFTFEFDHRMRVATLGGLIFGIQALPNLFLLWAMPAVLYGKKQWDDLVFNKKSQHEQPRMADMTFWKESFKKLVTTAHMALLYYFVQGTIGLACLGWAAWDADDSYAKAAYWIVFGCSMVGLVISCGLCGLKVAEYGMSEEEVEKDKEEQDEDVAAAIDAVTGNTVNA